MNSSLRRSYFPAIAACLTLAVRLSGADTPPPTPAAGAPSVTATAPAPAPRVMTIQLPKALEGVVTQEEFESYIKFQQGLRDDPDIKALNDQMRVKTNEMIELRKQFQVAQQKALDANPDIKAIVDKMRRGKPRPPMVPPASPIAAPTAAPTPVSK